MGVKCEACQHEHENWVPAERLSKATQDRNAAEAERDAQIAKVVELTAGAARVAELEASMGTLAGERDRLAMQADILRSGIVDDEGMQVVSTLWAALPEDARPPDGLRGWLTSPDAPRAVRAYLAPAAPPAPAAPDAPAAVPPIVPPSSRSVDPQPPSPAGQMSPAQVAAMSPNEYRAWRDSGAASQALQQARAGQQH
jgi:hypothetical protein